jgi:hypothetical protein
MAEVEVGDRVQLLRCNDPYTKLEPGMLGIVRSIDSMGTVHVEWENGSRLGMVTEDGDSFRVIEPRDLT